MADVDVDGGDWDFQDAENEFAPATITARVCFDQKLVTEIERLEADLASIESMEEGRDISARLVDLHAELRAKERPFTFVARSPREYSDLLRAHAPTPEQRLADRRIDHNPDTFPQALILACCTVPSNLTAERVEWMKTGGVTYGQWNRLWLACLSVNVGSDGVGKALSSTALLLSSEPSSTTAVPEVSPEASSSDES